MELPRSEVVAGRRAPQIPTLNWGCISWDAPSPSLQFIWKKAHLKSGKYFLKLSKNSGCGNMDGWRCCTYREITLLWITLYYSPIRFMNRTRPVQSLHLSTLIFLLFQHRPRASCPLITMIPSQEWSVSQAFWQSDKDKDLEYGLGSMVSAPYPL